MEQSSRCCKQLPETLNDRHVYVMASIFFDGKSQQEVADELGTSQQWVSQLMAQAEKRLEAAGLPMPTKRKQARMLLCPGQYMDRLEKCGSGRFRSAGGGENDAAYRPWN